MFLADRCGIHVCVCSRLPAGRFSSRGRSRGADAAAWNMSLPDNTPPAGFTALFNGKDLTNWKGLVSPDKGPPGRAAMTPDQLAAAQKVADKQMRDHWTVVDGVLHYDGKGQSLCRPRTIATSSCGSIGKSRATATAAFICAAARRCRFGTVQHAARGRRLGRLVQQSKTSARSAGQGRQTDRRMEPILYPHGRRQGDGLSQWQAGGRQCRVGELLGDNKPIYPSGQIELQHHNSTLFFKNIYLRELK